MDIGKNNMNGIECLNVLPGRKSVVEGVDFAVYAELKGVDDKIPDQRIILHHSNLNVGYDCPPLPVSNQSKCFAPL
jgi:hypothetical protein